MIPKAIICDFKFIVANIEKGKFLLYDSRGIQLDEIIDVAYVPTTENLKKRVWHSISESFSKEIPVPISAKKINAETAYVVFSTNQLSIKITQGKKAFSRDIPVKWLPKDFKDEIHITDPIYLDDDRIIFFELIAKSYDLLPNRGEYPKTCTKAKLTLNFVGCICHPGDTFPTYHGIFMHIIDTNLCKEISCSRVIQAEKMSDPLIFPRIYILSPLKTDITKTTNYLNKICPSILRELHRIIIDYLSIQGKIEN